MIFPRITMATSGVMGLFYLVLVFLVIRGRFREQQSHGTPVDPKTPLSRLIRVHGNFSEYVPFILLQMALLEITGANVIALAVIALILFVARLLHWIGLLEKHTPNWQRAAGMVGTTTLMACLSAWLLWRAFA